MKEYIVRLTNYEGFVIDGLIITASNEIEALSSYIKQRPTVYADKCVYDKFTIEEYFERS